MLAYALTDVYERGGGETGILVRPRARLLVYPPQGSGVAVLSSTSTECVVNPGWAYKKHEEAEGKEEKEK